MCYDGEIHRHSDTIHYHVSLNVRSEERTVSIVLYLFQCCRCSSALCDHRPGCRSNKQHVAEWNFFSLIRCPTVGRRLGSETWAALQFTVPLLLRHNSLYNPTGMHFFFFLFFCIICIMSEHQNTAHLGCFCTYSQRFANWSCTIQKCVHFCYCWKIKIKKERLQWFNCMSNL